MLKSLNFVFLDFSHATDITEQHWHSSIYVFSSGLLSATKMFSGLSNSVRGTKMRGLGMLDLYIIFIITFIYFPTLSKAFRTPPIN